MGPFRYEDNAAHKPTTAPLFQDTKMLEAFQRCIGSHGGEHVLKTKIRQRGKLGKDAEQYVSYRSLRKMD